MMGEADEDFRALLKPLFAAMAADLELLALLHDREISKEQTDILADYRFSEGLGLQLNHEKASLVIKSLDECLEQLITADGSGLLDELACDYAAIYLNHTYRASPLESVWIDDENLVCQDAMFDVRETYKKYGMSAENWRIRSDDHLVCQMQFFSTVMRNSEPDMTVLRDLADFYDEHLFRWLNRFSQRVSERCRLSFYASLGELTELYFESMRDCFAEILAEPRPDREAIEKRITQRKALPEAVVMQYMPGHSPSW